MNIIDCWIKAKDGQLIQRKAWEGSAYKKEGRIDDFFRSRTGDWNNSLLADDWEVVKLPNKEEMTMGELRKRNGNYLISTHIPDNAKVVITWED